MSQLGTQTAGSSADTAEFRRTGHLRRVACVAYRRRGWTLASWLAALLIAVGLSAAFAGAFTADYSAPDSDSRAALSLLKDRFPAQSGDTVQVVVHADEGVMTSDSRAAVVDLLSTLAEKPHVAEATDPYAVPGSISPDGRTLIAQLYLDVTNPVDMPLTHTQKLIHAAGAAKRPGFDVSLGGQSIQAAEQGQIGSEAIGLTAATLILLLTFGSVVAAGLPVAVAVAGLAVSGTLASVAAAIVDVPDWSTALASMISIGIGIDYTLLMVTRFREWRAAGLTPEEATIATVDTAGRTVLIAGSTVIISMLGLFAMGLSYMRGAATLTIIAVLVVMAATLTLFPALLGSFGRHIDRLRLPLGRRRALGVTPDEQVRPTTAWMQWSRLVDRHRVLFAITGLVVLLALAVPFLHVRFGFPDAGNDPQGRMTRQAYDTVADAFGPGRNGPLLLAAELQPAGNTVALQALVADIQPTPGVAAVAPPQLNQTGDAAVLTVIPTTGPQDESTKHLVHRLRDDILPQATDGTGTTVHVGGHAALTIDSTDNITRRIPMLIGGVVMMSMAVLLLAFRSIAIPITAAAMNLLSVAAAYGVTALFLKGGWVGQLIGIDNETPMPAFIPVLTFAVLFGLSMDYEVFLISRMRESWIRTRNNGRAILDGLAGTGRIITTAAVIMIAVFAAFIPSPEVFLKVIGIGMATAILVDATVVRTLLVPAVMHMLGPANWWLPAWLDRRLPQLHTEEQRESSLRASTQPMPMRST
jgi:putative drug exporter of the RND superfamily